MTRHKKHSEKSIILGNKFLTRARIIFVFSILAVVSLIGISTYNSSKTGSIQKNIIQPIKKAGKSFMEFATREPSPIPTPYLNPEFQESQTTIITNTTTRSEEEQSEEDTYNVKVIYSYPEQTSYTQQDSNQQVIDESNRWFEEQKAANEKWFQEQSAKNSDEYRARYESSVQEMDAEYNANVQKARDEQEAWKKAHGF